ncbi:MAG: response regulator transcription factor [Aggregatilineales bacterium]
MPTPRVLVIADTLLARVGLAALLDTQAEVDVVGQVAGDATLLDDLDIYRPDVVVFDLGYEPASLLSRLTALVDAGMPLVVLMSDETTLPSILPALGDANAYGLLLRDSDADLLAGALVAVSGGLVTLDPALATSLIITGGSPLESPAETLTPRESEVLQLLSQGLTNKAIALDLGISPNTVKFHINAILTKLDAQSRTEAVVRATRLGWIIL